MKPGNFLSKPAFSKTVRLGLVGCGTVGSGVVKIIQDNSRAIESKTGIRLEIAKVCVRSLKKKRAVHLSKSILTTDVKDILNDPSIDIVVELIGGLHPAADIVHRSFAQGKHVVTANKALLAEKGSVIFDLAALHGRRLGIEASVCAGIPIIQALKGGLASNNISQILGIVNGTCNYILTAMQQRGASFAATLGEAQAKGYAEADPAFDVDGIDSAHKLAVLARLAFGVDVPFKSIPVEGISKLKPEDIEYALQLGYVIKLLAIGKRRPLNRQPTSAGASVADGRNDVLELRVHPTMLPYEHPLSNVRGVYNAVFVQADQAGDLLFYGRGAGMMPTASAVLSDVLDIARDVVADAPCVHDMRSLQRVHIASLDELRSKYYLRFQVVDRPGVLGRIAQTLGKHGISILSVHQKESHDPRSTPVVILTYEASERNLRRALKEIDAQKDVREKSMILRVEQ